MVLGMEERLRKTKAGKVVSWVVREAKLLCVWFVNIENSETTAGALSFALVGLSLCVSFLPGPRHLSNSLGMLMPSEWNARNEKESQKITKIGHVLI